MSQVPMPDGHAVDSSHGPLEQSPQWQQWFALCCGLLRGERQQWPGDNHGDATLDGFLDFLRFHGIDCLVHERLALLDAAPPALNERLWQLVRQRAAWELRDRHLLAQVLAALQARGIAALVFKGAALAHTHYATPVSRARGDSDVLVPQARLADTEAVLVALGYRPSAPDSDTFGYQRDYVHGDEGGQHVIDLHWQVNDSGVLAQLFPFAGLAGRAAVLPALGAQARCPGAIDALLVACVHRRLHEQAHYSVNDIHAMTGDRLIWIADIDRLVRAFAETDWQRFTAAARDKGLAATCRDSLRMAQRCFATPLPAGWEAALPDASTAVADRYLAAGPLGRLWLDFRASDRKAALCRQLLFPSAIYMYDKYATARVRWLPWLYLRRAIGGLASRFVTGAKVP